MEKIKLLIVDDERAIRELLRKTLTICDRFAGRIESVEVAANLDEAMNFIRDGSVNTVLCDGFFPMHEGGDTGENWIIVQEMCQVRDIAFLLYSGTLESVFAARRMNVGALAKPALAAEIYKLVVDARGVHAA